MEATERHLLENTSSNKFREADESVPFVRGFQGLPGAKFQNS